MNHYTPLYIKMINWYTNHIYTKKNNMALSIETSSRNIEESPTILSLPYDERIEYGELREIVRQKLTHPLDDHMLAEVPYTPDDSRLYELEQRAKNLSSLENEAYDEGFKLKFICLPIEKQNRYFELREIVRNQQQFAEEWMALEYVTDEDKEMNSISSEAMAIEFSESSIPNVTHKTQDSARDILAA